MVFRRRGPKVFSKRGGFCPRCGNPIDLKHDAYCMRCGYQLHRRMRRKSSLFTILIIILIILASIAAVRYYQGKPIIPDFSFLKNFSQSK